MLTKAQREAWERQAYGNVTSAQIDEGVRQAVSEPDMLAMGRMSDAQELMIRAHRNPAQAGRLLEEARQLLNQAKYLISEYLEPAEFRYYRNAQFRERNYECMNLVACKAPASTSIEGHRNGVDWVSTSARELEGLDHLWTEAGVEFWGYL